jgi:hypothetical protein
MLREKSMDIRVIYSTEALLSKNGELPGKQVERSFTFLDEAKSAPLPAGYVFALISTNEGKHVYTAKFGWEFTPRDLP